MDLQQAERLTTKASLHRILELVDSYSREVLTAKLRAAELMHKYDEAASLDLAITAQDREQRLLH